jgi:hypothetical protein
MTGGSFDICCVDEKAKQSMNDASMMARQANPSMTTMFGPRRFAAHVRAKLRIQLSKQSLRLAEKVAVAGLGKARH